MRTLRYGADAEWAFAGFDLPLSEAIVDATLTIKPEWAEDDQEAPDNPAWLEIAGVIVEAQDGDGNWLVSFAISPADSIVDLAPPPRYLWYEVTLHTDALTLKPFVGQVRMLPVIHLPAS